MTPTSPRFIELPDWTDPPTGQVPRVLLDEDGERRRRITRGPSWRQDSSDWNEDMDLSIFDRRFTDRTNRRDRRSSGSPRRKAHPFAFGDLGLDEDDRDRVADETDDEAWAECLVNDATRRYGLNRLGHRRSFSATRRASCGDLAIDSRVTAPSARPASLADRRTPAPHKRACCWRQRPESLRRRHRFVVLRWSVGIDRRSFTLVVVLVGAGEMFAALRRVGFGPATLPGLVTSPRSWSGPTCTARLGDAVRAWRSASSPPVCGRFRIRRARDRSQTISERPSALSAGSAYSVLSQGLLLAPSAASASPRNCTRGGRDRPHRRPRRRFVCRWLAPRQAIRSLRR